MSDGPRHGAVVTVDADGPGVAWSSLTTTTGLLSELTMGWVDPVGWVGSRFFSYCWVGLDRAHYSKGTKM